MIASPPPANVPSPRPVMVRPAVPRPVVLCILDGWGWREETEDNAIAAARTPHWDALLERFPHTVLDASEQHVGLPDGQMGNSEVGHMNIGAGRVVMQDLPRIDAAIADGSLATHPGLQAFIQEVKHNKGACHLLGLLSPGGVHSHQQHMAVLARIVAGAGVPVWVHAFTDGRDTPPQSALEYLARFESAVGGNMEVRMGTVSGRYYAMDRDNRWDRVQRAYTVMAQGVAEAGHAAGTASQALAASYAGRINDEFVVPTLIGDYPGMRDGDGLLMANFRADRSRQILSTLLDPAFTGFPRPVRPRFSAALGMVEYSAAHTNWMRTLFAPESLEHNLGEVVSRAGRTQLRLAETEKYAHVTFFFNGGREEPFTGEDRILIPSPNVATYDLQPEMSAPAVTEALTRAIRAGKHDLIVVNYANTDMVGHSGNLAAAVQAVEAVDTALGQVWHAVEQAGGALLITADHGNAECMREPGASQPHTAHTLEKVPFVLACAGMEGTALPASGQLADIAPTVLHLMGLPQPAAMTGRAMVERVVVASKD